MTRNHLLVLLVVAAIGLAACGTADDADAPSATPSPVSTASTSSPSASSSDAPRPFPTSAPSSSTFAPPPSPAPGEPDASTAPTEGVAGPFLGQLRRCATEGTGVVGDVTFDSVDTWVGGTDATIDGHLVDIVATIDATSDPERSPGVTRVDLVVLVDELVAGSAIEVGERVRIAMEVGCADFATSTRRLLPDGGIGVIAQVQDTGRYDDSPATGSFVAPNHQAVLFVDAGGGLVALDGRPARREADTRDALLALLRNAADRTG